jgi:hypothetical protein
VYEGTGPEVYANINAPEAVTYSAIIYCLRCLISEDIPLNQGCLKPIHVKIPPGSFLSPSNDAAVVGGNVLTSQRVTDVVLKAFKACAASQGDCEPPPSILSPFQQLTYMRQQPHLRLRRHRRRRRGNQRLRLLRNHRRRQRCRTDMERHKRRTHTHDQHAYHG